jgi:glucose-1-phosphate thymidylyltransferase
MKGIVLAGGTGSRLWPVTWAVSKQLIPIYDKPLVHYPIATLMLAGIREMLIISTPQDFDSFKRLLGSGEKYGVRFGFAIQEEPKGLADAFIVGADFIGDDKVSLILGDNIFYGSGLGSQLSKLRNIDGAHIFAYKVQDPQQYGVVEFDSDGRVVTLEEKPLYPRSSYAVPGLYFYDNQVIDIAQEIRPSSRGELEITSVNQKYLQHQKLYTTILERGTAWLDTGTFESLNAASELIQIIEERQGQKISCLEEVAWRNGWISDSDLKARADEYKSSPFADYLRSLLV